MKMSRVALREVAFARSGDKGDTSNIGLVPYRPHDLDWLLEQVTIDRVQELFGSEVQGPIHRYTLGGISAINFVLERALSGGVSRSLNLDAHGKSWGNLLLRMEVEAPPGWMPGWLEESGPVE
jgi:hypothetical protein